MRDRKPIKLEPMGEIVCIGDVKTDFPYINIEIPPTDGHPRQVLMLENKDIWRLKKWCEACLKSRIKQTGDDDV